MSVILYCQDVGFFADQKHVLNVLDRVVVSYQDKIYIDPEYRFAYTYTGTPITPNKEDFNKAIETQLETLKLHYKYTDAFKPLNGILTGEGVLLLYITGVGVFGIQGNIATRIDALPFYGDGTGGGCAEMHLRLNGDPVKAIEYAIKRDSCCGGDVNFVLFEDIEEKRKEYLAKQEKKEVNHVNG